MIYEIGRKTKNGHTYIQYMCDVCSNQDWMRADHFQNGTGCNVCSNRKVAVGVNDVATTHPEIVRLLANKADAYLYCAGSSKRVLTQCPECGFQKSYPLSDLKAGKYSCPQCSDGISFPNRFVGCVLQTIGVHYIPEAKFKWAGTYRYDFYLPSKQMIIEVHGRQHYTGAFEKQGKYFVVDTKNDEQKKLIALNNGIESYVVIDARQSNWEHIRNSIYQAHIFKDEELSTINWDDVVAKAMTHIARLCLLEWETEKSIRKISEQLKISIDTVRKYLKMYASIGKCDYDPHVAVIKNQHLASKARKRLVRCITTGEVFGSVNSAASAYGIKPKSLTECFARKRRNPNCKASSGRLPTGERLEWELIKEENSDVL